MHKSDRKIGHRRVGEGGEITYKKIQSSQIMGSIQLGKFFSKYLTSENCPAVFLILFPQDLALFRPGQELTILVILRQTYRANKGSVINRTNTTNLMMWKLN